MEMNIPKHKAPSLIIPHMEVSVVTPTYNRRRFIPTMIQIYKNQTFPKEKMEWIVLDDGRDSVADLFANTGIPNLRYIRLEEKMRIGAKRNYLNKEARAPIIISMDDDDYYPPKRVQIIVDAFAKYPRVDLAGSSELYMYYIDSKTIYHMGSHGPNRATNGTMAWRKRYSDQHRYDDFVTHAEEESFLDNYRWPMIQLDAKKTNLMICHQDNTVNKTDLKREHEEFKGHHKAKMKLTTLKIEDIVQEPELRDFYRSI